MWGGTVPYYSTFSKMSKKKFVLSNFQFWEMGYYTNGLPDTSQKCHLSTLVLVILMDSDLFTQENMK